MQAISPLAGQTVTDVDRVDICLTCPPRFAHVR
jgi:hypothetical protein